MDIHLEPQTQQVRSDLCISAAGRMAVCSLVFLGLKMEGVKSRSNQIEELIEELKTEFRLQQRFTFQDDNDPKLMYNCYKSVSFVPPSV